MVTQQTATERWEEVLEVECLHCGGPTPILPVRLGVEIGDGILCTPCFHRVYYGSLSLARQALAPEPDGDDDGGPAAPSARPVALALVAAGCGPAWVELSPADEARLDAFEAAVAESRDPEPCARCGKVASPGVATDAGTFCLTCGEAEPSALPAIRQWRLWRTCARIQAARLGRNLAALR